MTEQEIREIQIEFDKLAFEGNLAGLDVEWLNRMGTLATRVRKHLAQLAYVEYDIPPWLAYAGIPLDEIPERLRAAVAGHRAKGATP